MQDHSNAEKDFNFYFRQDLQRLLNEFNLADSFRYSDFVKIWKEMKFYQIFMLPRFFPFDYRFFMKDILKIAVEYFHDKELDLEVRTAALYSLYGLYIFQANRPRLKIPITPSQWINILQFVDLINEAEHSDVEYIFRYLLYSDAFEFCTAYEINNRNPTLIKPAQKLPKANQITANSESKGSVQLLSMDDFKSLVFTDEIAEQMGTIHEAYLQIKESKMQSGAMNESIKNYINTDFKSLLNAEIVKDLNEIVPSLADKKEANEQKYNADREQPCTSSSLEVKNKKTTANRNESDSDNTNSIEVKDEDDDFEDIFEFKKPIDKTSKRSNSTSKTGSKSSKKTKKSSKLSTQYTSSEDEANDNISTLSDAEYDKMLMNFNPKEKNIQMKDDEANVNKNKLVDSSSSDDEGDTNEEDFEEA